MYDQGALRMPDRHGVDGLNGSNRRYGSNQRDRMIERRIYALKKYKRARRIREWRGRCGMLASRLQSRWKTFWAFVNQSSVGPYLVGVLFGAVLVMAAWKGFSLATAELRHDIRLIKDALTQGDLCSPGEPSTAGQHTKTRGHD